MGGTCAARAGTVRRRLGRRSCVGVVVVLAALLGLAQPGPAQDPELEVVRARAQEGDPAAQFQLGFLYDTGWGGQQDDAQALRWYRSAAESGHPDAQYNLGVMYDSGQGVAKDAAEAARWYREAAERGHGLAQLNLGAAYGDGEGVPRDYVQAFLWLSLAVERLEGNERDIAFGNRERAASHMSREQQAEAARLVRDWKPKPTAARK